MASTTTTPARATAKGKGKQSAAAAAKAKVAARKGTAKGTQAKASAAKASTAKAKTTAKAKQDDGPSKRELAAKRDAELTTEIVERRGNDEKWAEIASDLSITSGKAQFLMMKHDVAEGNVPAIKHRTENELVAGIRKARSAEDAYSSWGWISARAGVAEGKIKALATSAGMDVKGTNISTARAATATNGQTKTGGTAKKATSSDAVKAKARAAKGKGKGKTSRPTSKG